MWHKKWVSAFIWNPENFILIEEMQKPIDVILTFKIILLY